MEFKFECPTCGQHLSATPAQIGVTASCPNCKTAVTVPNAPTLPPAPPPLPQVQPPPAAANTQPARPHTIFYYVFWGTVSLFATLVILFFGFIFLTAAGAGFIRGLSHHAPRVENTATAAQNSPAPTDTDAAQNLPALTDTEAQQAKSLLDELRVKRDDIEGITYYSPEPEDSFKTAVYLYIAQKQAGQPWLFWKIRYSGDEWLFIRRYRIKIDEAEAATLLPTKSLKRENSGGSVWETFNEKADKHAHLLNQMLAGNIVYLRMEGTEGNKDIELSAEQLQRMRDVLLAYRYLGGAWPAN